MAHSRPEQDPELQKNPAYRWLMGREDVVKLSKHILCSHLVTCLLFFVRTCVISPEHKSPWMWVWDSRVTAIPTLLSIIACYCGIRKGNHHMTVPYLVWLSLGLVGLVLDAVSLLGKNFIRPVYATDKNTTSSNLTEDEKQRLDTAFACAQLFLLLIAVYVIYCFWNLRLFLKDWRKRRTVRCTFDHRPSTRP